jgi:hypothetical protein
MDPFITIATFVYPHEAHTARLKLESEGFEVFLQDELMVQVHNFYSHAIGGVKLQVRKSEAEKAYGVLKEGEFIEDHKEESEKADKLKKINEFLGKSKLFRFLKNRKNIVILGIFILLVVIVPIVIFIIPNTEEKLLKYEWCVEEFEYLNKLYLTQTYYEGLVAIGPGCMEKIVFYKNGNVIFPGFNSYQIRGKWKLSEGKLFIKSTTSMDHVYEGEYNIKVNSKILFIESKNTKITAKPNIFNFNL